MTVTRSATAAAAAASPKPALANFRLGENNLSDGDESDDDQSVTSERSVSPPKADGKRTKSKKKRERKRIGALTDGLDTLLGAFTPNEASTNGPEKVDGDAIMQVEPATFEKKMNKRTRQNLARMEARKQRSTAKQIGAATAFTSTPNGPAQPNGKPLGDAQKKRKATDARRARKERARAAHKAAESDRMDIG